MKEVICMELQYKLYDLYFTDSNLVSKKYFDNRLDEIEWMVTDNWHLINGMYKKDFYAVKGTNSIRLAKCVNVNGFIFWIVPVTGKSVMNMLLERGWKRLTKSQLEMFV